MIPLTLSIIKPYLRRIFLPDVSDGFAQRDQHGLYSHVRMESLGRSETEDTNGGFLKWGTRIAKWFIMEKFDCTPSLGNHQIL